MARSAEEKPRFPMVLWLLPIFFGLFGGIVAALIANLKYQASWIELFIVGIVISFVLGGLWIWVWGGLFILPLVF